VKVICDGLEPVCNCMVILQYIYRDAFLATLRCFNASAWEKYRLSNLEFKVLWGERAAASDSAMTVEPKARRRAFSNAGW